MLKETTRPLLVEALEKAQSRETEALMTLQNLEHHLTREAWQLARLHRTVAELQLWLADRQWEREETEPEVAELKLAPEVEAALMSQFLASHSTKP